MSSLLVPGGGCGGGGREEGYLCPLVYTVRCWLVDVDTFLSFNLVFTHQAHTQMAQECKQLRQELTDKKITKTLVKKP